MTTDRDSIAVVEQHPRVVALGRVNAEREAAQLFASDLAFWLVGGARESLGVLARVVTVVASRELRDPKRMCRGRPLLAVEAAARAAELLWPLLRYPLDESSEESDGEEDSGGEGGGGGSGPSAAGGDVQGQGESSEESSEGEEASEEETSTTGQDDDESGANGEDEGEGADPMDVLRSLASGCTEAEEAELAELAARLQERLGQGSREELETQAGEELGEAASAALDGALEAARGARYLEHFLPGVSWSMAPGLVHRELLDSLHRMTAMLQQLKELEVIADALGRLEGHKEGRWWEEGGSEEVVGVRLGGDVTLALPSELGLLGDPELEDLFYQRYLERRLISMELQGGGMDGVGSPDERGPVIACIDTSGSMDGAPAIAAKALVLALCRRVLPQGRIVHLMAFGGPGQQTEIRIRRGMGGLEALLDFLALSFSGGTDFDTPLERALDLLEDNELGSADILVVTDGRCIPGEAMVERTKRVRDEVGVKIWSVVLGKNWSEGVQAFSDEVWEIDPANADVEGLLKKVGAR